MSLPLRSLSNPTVTRSMLRTISTRHHRTELLITTAGSRRAERNAGWRHLSVRNVVMKQNYITAECVGCIHSTSGSWDETQNGRTFCVHSTADCRSALLEMTARQATGICICSYVPRVVDNILPREDCLERPELSHRARTVCTTTVLWYITSFTLTQFSLRTPCRHTGR